MIFTRKIQIEFTDEDILILDGQSKICNWIYNKLLEIAIDDYTNNNNENEYLKGRRLRDLVPLLKKEHTFLKSVYSSPLKNVALRLMATYKKFFKENTGFPKFKSWKKDWFSILYEEKRGYKINGKYIKISLGVNDNDERLYIVGKLKEKLKLNNSNIKTFRIIKELGKYYAVFSIEKQDKIKEEKEESWIAIDPNHKNFFVCVDSNGDTYEYDNLPMVKYFDKQIDRVKSMRDRCLRKSIKCTTKSGKEYYKPSKRYQKLDKVLSKLYNKRREQIKFVLYNIANNFSKKYDIVAIGNYTPSLEVSVYKTMHRKMLNQTIIGQFRQIVSWVQKRSNKSYKLVDERDTTKTCSICGYKEKKDPSIREFTCTNCNTHLNRDINSSINIAKKGNLLSSSDYIGWNLKQPMYAAKWNYNKNIITFADYIV